MPIATVKEVFNGRDGGINERYERHYTRVFMVTMQNFSADALEATATPLIPGIGAFYTAPNGAVDRGARCRSVEAKQDEADHYLWYVVCKFVAERLKVVRHSEDPATHAGSGTMRGDPSETDPTQELPDISWDVVKFQKPIAKDISGKACVASNGERFDPPVMVDDTRFTLTITKYLLAYDPSQAYQYTDTINSNAWIFGIAPKTAKCETIKAQSVVKKRVWCWRVTFVFHIRPQGGLPWQLSVLDRGTYKIDATTMKPSAILDPKTKQAITSPVPLDGTGNPLTLTATPNYNYITFDLYPATDFSQLGLP